MARSNKYSYLRNSPSYGKNARITQLANLTPREYDLYKSNEYINEQRRKNKGVAGIDSKANRELVGGMSEEERYHVNMAGGRNRDEAAMSHSWRQKSIRSAFGMSWN